MTVHAARRSMGRHSSTLASLMLFLTLGVGTAEAWHGEEHADEEHCTECALCHVTAEGPVTPGIEAPETARHEFEGKLPAQGATVTILCASRRPDAPRAPPA